MLNRILFRVALVLGVAAILFGPPVCMAHAQAGLLGKPADPLGGFGALGGDASNAPLAIHASFTTADGDRPAQLSITAEIPKGWHIYSITQKDGGPNATQIKLAKSDQFRLIGKFTPNPPPKVHVDKPAFGDLPLEEHSDTVTWTAPIEIRPGLDPAQLKIQGAVNAQRCAESCLAPEDFPFTAEVAGRFLTSNGHLQLRGWIEPSVAVPGSTVKLVLSAEPESGYHIYPLADHDSHQVGEGKPTLIGLKQAPSWSMTRPAPDRAAAACKLPEPMQSSAPCYESTVRWTMSFTIPREAKPGEYPIEGIIGSAVCAQSCDPPQGARFEGRLIVGSAPIATAAPLVFSLSSYKEATELAGKPSNRIGTAESEFKPQIEGTEIANLPTAVLFSLLGGLILNLMPCVLPVIGLKVLTFVEQGGQSRARVFALNLWYSLGLMLVFMALATLAVYAGLAWGEQFQSAKFNIAVAALVFVMALSLLGVWEIPIPGFIGSGKAVEVAAREGAFGALAKGAFTTLLATPCSGPFLGAVFGYTLNKPPELVYLIFGSIGLGMASPYLLIGAFPSLVRFLPKPGAWMDTFKQLMGFLLLGTVVYLFTLLNHDYFVPTLALLFGLWVACWWIGRTPLTADFGRKLRAWVGGGAVATVVGLFAFHYLVPQPAVLPWQQYSTDRLQQLTGEGRTVMVDFTADWCPNCKVNLRFAIDTEGVLDVIKSNHVVPLVADWTDYSPEIRQQLAALGSKSIPVLAIFPADRPNQPIVLRDLLTESQVVDALRRAGKSHENVASGPASDKSVQNSRQLQWKPFSLERLAQTTAECKTVIVNFTAEWSLHSKWTLKYSLDTADVRELVDRNRVELLDADWTNQSPEISRAMGSLGRRLIPLLAIFPADRPTKPIVLHDLFTEKDVMNALHEAGPSHSANTNSDLHSGAEQVSVSQR